MSCLSNLEDATLREIGRIAREEDARILADHLLTLNITTRLESKGDGWAIWVHREDRVPEARAVLEDFEKTPSDPRFRSSAKTAKQIRWQAEKTEKAYRRKVKHLRNRWEGAMYLRAPLAFAMIVVSVAVAVLGHFFPSLDELCEFTVWTSSPERGWYDTGFAAIERGQVWRLITPIFLHADLFHLFFNMTAMRYLGERVEMRKGPWRFALICLVSAIGGNVAQYFVHMDGNFRGMSGVVYALAGYLWIKGHSDPGDGLALNERSVNWMLGWFLLGIVAPMTAQSNPAPSGFPYNMANAAHGVGLAVGMAFGLLRF